VIDLPATMNQKAPGVLTERLFPTSFFLPTKCSYGTIDLGLFRRNIWRVAHEFDKDFVPQERLVLQQSRQYGCQYKFIVTQLTPINVK
jgi:hypothetical protein